METSLSSILVALAVLLAVAVNGALWFSVRRHRTAGRLTLGVVSVAVRSMLLGTLFLLCAAGVQAQPRLETAFSESPAMWVFALLTALGLVTVWFCLRAKLEGAALLGACLFTAGMLPIAALSLSASPLPFGFWAAVGWIAMAGYSVFLLRHLRITHAQND